MSEFGRDMSSAEIERHLPYTSRVIQRTSWETSDHLKVNEARGRITNAYRCGHWKKWLELDEGKGGGRCLVPATAFSEYQDGPSPKDIVWFARPPESGDSRPLFFFAGIWREWEGVRGTKAAPVEGRHRVYSFLTTDPNAVVQPVHAKAMPVILTTPEQCDMWLDGDTATAIKLQAPAEADTLTVVARGKSKKDEVGLEEGK